MTTYVLRRILLFVPTLWVIATLSFFIVRLAPGGPFQSEKEIPAAARAQLMRTYGLDRPLPEQYVRFLANAARGDFGVSYRYPQRQVREIVSAGFRSRPSWAAGRCCSPCWRAFRSACSRR